MSTLLIVAWLGFAGVREEFRLTSSLLPEQNVRLGGDEIFGTLGGLPEEAKARVEKALQANELHEIRDASTLQVRVGTIGEGKPFAWAVEVPLHGSDIAQAAATATIKALAVFASGALGVADACTERHEASLVRLSLNGEDLRKWVALSRFMSPIMDRDMTLNEVADQVEHLARPWLEAASVTAILDKADHATQALSFAPGEAAQ